MRHDVYPGLLFTWRRQAREGRLVAGALAEFVPVRLVDAPDQPGPVLPPGELHIRKTACQGRVSGF